MQEYLVPILGSAVAGVLAYMAARRRSSGRVDTSDAKDLWAESNAMRRELREEVIALRGQLASAHAEADRLRDRVGELETKLGELSGRVDQV